MDQSLVSVRITEFNEANKCQLAKMTYSGLRFDRGFYDDRKNDTPKSVFTLVSNYGLVNGVRIALNFYNIFNFIDFHSFQEKAFKKISLIEQVIDPLFDADTNQMIKKYHQEFIRIKLKNNIYNDSFYEIF